MLLDRPDLQPEVAEEPVVMKEPEVVEEPVVVEVPEVVEEPVVEEEPEIVPEPEPVVETRQDSGEKVAMSRVYELNGKRIEIAYINYNKVRITRGDESPVIKEFASTKEAVDYYKNKSDCTFAEIKNIYNFKSEIFKESFISNIFSLRLLSFL